MIETNLSGKVFLVTGASRGLGAETMLRLCQAGAVGAVNYVADPDEQNRRDAEEVLERITAGGGEARLYQANISDAGQVEEMVGQILADHGRLDGVVNNAGILRDRTVRKMTGEEWQSVIDINLTGTFHVCKYAAEVMVDGGRIVNISSISGVLGPFGQANYAASKAGVIALTKVLSRELARRQITVNAVAPGLIETDMYRQIKEEARQQMLGQIPLGRVGQPTDIANTVLFLCSDLAAYITGQVIHVNGGWYM